MKVVSFFSRFAALCNICFLIYIFLREAEARKHATNNNDIAVPVPYLKDIIITLGVGAVIINIAMCIVYAILVIIGKQKIIPKWLATINLVFLIFQFIYFFV